MTEGVRWSDHYDRKLVDLFATRQQRMPYLSCAASPVRKTWCKDFQVSARSLVHSSFGRFNRLHSVFSRQEKVLDLAGRDYRLFAVFAE